MKKVCMIASCGGHLEQLRQLTAVSRRYDCFYVVPDTPSTRQMAEKRYLVLDLVRKNRLRMTLRMARMFVQQLGIFWREKPQVILTTGAAVAIPMCIIGKWMGAKVIYIESFARIHTPNRTGRLLYRFADLFVIQWEQLKKYYPKAVYGGSIYG